MQRRQLLKNIAGASACIGASSLLMSIPFAVNATIADKSQIGPLANIKTSFDDALKDNPSLLGLKNTANNFDHQQLTLEGELPKDLTGVFYRNGPAKYEQGNQRYSHQFEGDGMINSFTFANGKIVHQGKFVETTKFVQEQQQNKFLYSGPLSEIKSSRKVTQADTVNTANINVIPVDDEIWALWESGSATVLDATTLATKRRVNLGANSQYG